MIYYFIFPIIVFISSILGAMAGIGGGVIIRPVLSSFGYFELAEVTNMISTICVFFIAVTSIVRHIISRTKIQDVKISIFLGIGAVIGGLIGQFLFNYIKNASNKNVLLIVQSSVLIGLLIFVLIYMGFFKPRGIALHIRNYFLTSIIGIFLGLSSTFLGIGGGPINVAVLLLFFGMDMKQAAINSLITIIFSQTSKLVTSSFDGTFATLFNISSLPTPDNNWWIFLLILIPVSIIGSLLGTYLNKKMSAKFLSVAFMATIVVIICINVYLIINSSITLATPEPVVYIE